MSTDSRLPATSISEAGMRSFGMLMDGRAQATGIRQRGQDATLLMVLNAHYDVVRFVLPAAAGGGGWTRLLDTNIPDDDTAVDFATGDHYDITARSLLLFMLQR